MDRKRSQGQTQQSSSQTAPHSSSTTTHSSTSNNSNGTPSTAQSPSSTLSSNLTSPTSPQPTTGPIHYPKKHLIHTPPVSLQSVSERKKLDPTGMIVDVWSSNLQEELGKIMEIVDDYPYIAMDTEFPGVVAKPVGSFKSQHDYHYQTLKCNVDLLKIIQLGLCFCDAEGHLLPNVCTWQFNFKFNLSEDMYAQDSIDLLSKSGIDFKEHDAKGIDVSDFGEILMTSGIVLNEEVKWISFHSGYDYGYLLKVLTCQALPNDEAEFFDLLRAYFPCVYDIKYLMKSCENLKGGLQKVAETLNIERIGPQHQAGSDSLLTAATFFKMKKMFFEDQIDDEKYMGVLFGLGQNLKHREKKERDRDQQ